jgi:hypothetical protein
MSGRANQRCQFGRRGRGGGETQESQGGADATEEAEVLQGNEVDLPVEVVEDGAVVDEIQGIPVCGNYRAQELPVCGNYRAQELPALLLLLILFRDATPPTLHRYPAAEPQQRRGVG